MRKFVAGAVVGSFCLAAAPTAVVAAPVTGLFTITGQEDVRVGLNFIDFGVFNDIWGTPIGGIDFLTGEGTFAGIAGTDGEIKDLVAQPVDTPIVINEFIKAFALPGLTFTLTELVSGVGSLADCAPPSTPGDTCTIPGSPLTLINTSTSSFAVTARVLGFVTNELGEVSDFTGDFTSQQTRISLETALGMLDDEDDFIQSSFSAEFAFEPRVVTDDGGDGDVPEPASMALMGLALSGVAVALRRRKN